MEYTIIIINFFYIIIPKIITIYSIHYQKYIFRFPSYINKNMFQISLFI